MSGQYIPNVHTVPSRVNFFRSRVRADRQGSSESGIKSPLGVFLGDSSTATSVCGAVMYSTIVMAAEHVPNNVFTFDFNHMRD